MNSALKNIATSTLFLLLLLPFIGKSQDCSERIDQAKKYYNNGQLAEIIQLLDTCQTELHGNELWNVHRLLALSYLGLEKNSEARQHVIAMMEISPEKKPNVLTDPVDLIKLMNTVTIIPKFSLGFGVMVGPSLTIPRPYGAYMLTDQVKHYTGKNSLQFGLSSSYQFNTRLAMDLSVLVSTKSYDLDYSFGNWDMKMDEKLTYFDVPIYLRYLFPGKKRLLPYGQAGLYGGYLLLGNNNFDATFTKDESSFELININSANRRNRLDYGIGAGLGCMYKLKKGHLFFQANYLHSMANISDADKRYTYPDLQQSYQYLDDDMRLSMFSIGGGFAMYMGYKVIKDK
ncbi:MAG: PorT family protein [Flavobacteriales bacterium]|nr:PorT family protein [Bacteroidota bacterium]MCB9241694.1 PorT family protein [Flavobacteriales bacterium]